MSAPVTGAPRVLLRLESLAVGAAAIVAFHHSQESWTLFAVLFLFPDLSMLGYVAGPRVGAVSYNALHWYVFPLVFIAIGTKAGLGHVLSIGLIWVAHIAMDRALGFGLKYSEGFGATHLGKAAVR